MSGKDGQNEQMVDTSLVSYRLYMRKLRLTGKKPPEVIHSCRMKAHAASYPLLWLMIKKVNYIPIGLMGIIGLMMASSGVLIALDAPWELVLAMLYSAIGFGAIALMFRLAGKDLDDVLAVVVVGTMTGIVWPAWLLLIMLLIAVGGVREVVGLYISKRCQTLILPPFSDD